MISKDEVKFMRIRTKKHEIMISPGKQLAQHEFPMYIEFSLDDRYLLAVLHDPTT